MNNPTIEAIITMLLEDLTALANDPDAHLKSGRLVGHRLYVSGKKTETCNPGQQFETVTAPNIGEFTNSLKVFWNLARSFLKSGGA